jgi:DNA-binding CsgD family transcriptional regulator
MHLTSRQLDILGLVAVGLSDKQIALKLGVSRRTVRTHFEKLFAEHGLRSRAEAVALWLGRPSSPLEPRPAKSAAQARERWAPSVGIDRVKQIGTSRHDLAAVGVPYADSLWARQAQQLNAVDSNGDPPTTADAMRGLAIRLLTELGTSLQAKRAILEELCLPLDACIELVQTALQQFIKDDERLVLIPELMPNATIGQAEERALEAAVEAVPEPQLGLA